MSILVELYDLVLTGKRAEVEEAVERAVDGGVAPMEIVEETLRPAMREVGERFARAEFFLPDLILAAEAMKRATEYLRPLLANDANLSKQETVVIGTAEGDLHDIGKNLVITLLEGSGHRVIDLGVDVAPERFVEAVREHDPAVVGLSALLSTTMVKIPRTIRALTDAGLRQGRIIAVGGAPVTQRNADEWEAELYAPDAGTAVRKLNDMIADPRRARKES
jgi:5-methyltetrahydrofolate--homocysteine methyltransferase